MNRSGLGRWLTMFSEGQAICAHVRDLPPAERPVLEAMEIKSVMCVPVISQHKRRGLLGFDMCRRERLWTDQERDVLRAAASMVAEAIRRSEAEASQMLVTRELDHRVKNNLASVLAIAEQTARRTEDISSFLSAFSGRVQALAIAHEVITRQRLLGGSFRALLDEMAQPFRRGTPDRIVISGSDILLPCDLVPAMAMIVNELFTNAIKHGSLRTETGRIRIGWDADKRPDGTGLLHVLWDEQGSDPAPNLGPRGFGTSLIETMAAHQLRGSAAIEMKPMGSSAAWKCRFHRQVRFSTRLLHQQRCRAHHEPHECRACPCRSSRRRIRHAPCRADRRHAQADGPDRRASDSLAHHAALRRRRVRRFRRRLRISRDDDQAVLLGLP